MRIDISRSGGFAGLTRRWSIEPDGEEEDQWRELIDACPWDEADDGGNQPDRYIYRIEAVQYRSAVREQYRATVPEHLLSGAWRQLIEKTQQAAGAEHDS